jgi:hypothetical protein
MPDTPQIGAGTSFSYSTDNGSTFTSLAKIIGFTPHKVQVAKVPTDAFDNPTFNGNPVESVIPGWVTPGTYGLKLHFLKTAWATIQSLIGVQGTGATTTKFKVIKSDGSGYIITGWIMEAGEEIPLKEAMTVDVTVQISNAVPTFNTTQG